MDFILFNDNKTKPFIYMVLLPFPGLYRLCGSATKKRILREAFERNARTVDLSPDNVPDINVITGKWHFYTEIMFKMFPMLLKIK